MQNVADQLRLSLGPASLDPSEIRSTIATLQAVRDEMVQHQACVGNRMYTMTFILECLMFSGMLRDDTQLREALIRSVKIAVPDERVRAYYEDLLAGGAARIPSHMTLSRSRLTLHMVFAGTKRSC